MIHETSSTGKDTGREEGCQLYRIGRGGRICQSWGSGRKGKKGRQEILDFLKGTEL
tara:strand:+ start:58 stop:225 length:168 start_codon:yes stop_codon:yes gene_type:complete